MINNLKYTIAQTIQVLKHRSSIIHKLQDLPTGLHKYTPRRLTSRNWQCQLYITQYGIKMHTRNNHANKEINGWQWHLQTKQMKLNPRLKSYYTPFRKSINTESIKTKCVWKYKSHRVGRYTPNISTILHESIKNREPQRISSLKKLVPGNTYLHTCIYTYSASSAQSLYHLKTLLK